MHSPTHPTSESSTDNKTQGEMTPGGASVVSFRRTSPCHFVHRNLRHISYDGRWHHISSRGPWQIGRLDVNSPSASLDDDIPSSIFILSTTSHKVILPFCDDGIFHLASFSEVDLLATPVKSGTRVSISSPSAILIWGMFLDAVRLTFFFSICGEF